MIGFVVVRFERYIKGLRHYDEVQSSRFAEQEFPRLSAHEVVQLGTAQTPENRPATSYMEYPITKPEGAIRIGVFGCSTVRGAETASGFDFPSLLQRKLHVAGFEEAEVINFGVGGYGTHQSFLLWEYLGKQYELDLTIFNLYEFHLERDNSFVYLNDAYAPVHARYIMDDKTLTLVPVVGRNRREASERYFSLVPPWRYIRYDAKAPVVLRALGLRSRPLTANPLYYRSRVFEEMQRTYEEMMRKIAESGSSTVVLCTTARVCTFEERIASPNIHFLHLRSTAATFEFPSIYRAPLDHLSATGNDLVAQEIFDNLMGQDSLYYPRISMKAIPDSITTLSEHQALDWRISDLVVLVDGVEGGKVVESIRGREQRFRRFEPPAAGSWGLIDISTRRQLRFVLWEGSPPDGAKVELRFSLNGDEVAETIGYVEMADPLLGWISGRGFTGSSNGVAWSAEILPETPTEEVRIRVRSSGSLADNVRLSLEGETFLGASATAQGSVAGSRRYVFDRALGGARVLHVRSFDGQYVDVRAIARSGLLEFGGKQGGVLAFRVPVRAYRLLPSPDERGHPMAFTMGLKGGSNEAP